MKIVGTVIHGDGYGRKLGYPTANITLGTPLSGVFSGTVTYKGKTYAAAIFATNRRPILEAHLFDFDGDLYGEDIVVEVGEKIREAEEFSNVSLLKAAIAADIARIRSRNTIRM